MPKQPARDITKLPVWARDIIERQQRDIEYLHNKLAEGPADSVIYLGNMPGRDYGTPGTPLGDDSVYFHLDSGWIQCDVRHGKLNLHAYNGMLSLEPQSGNVANATVRQH